MFDLESGTLFVIPDDLVNQVPCQTQTNLYTDNALDIDIDDDEWVRLSRDEQYGRLTAKQAAEARAVAACGTCPLLDQFRPLRHVFPARVRTFALLADSDYKK